MEYLDGKVRSGSNIRLSHWLYLICQWVSCFEKCMFNQLS